MVNLKDVWLSGIVLVIVATIVLGFVVTIFDSRISSKKENIRDLINKIKKERIKKG